MAETFNRWLGGPGDLPAGMYTLRTESKRACISCPLCGTHFDLPPQCGPDQAGRSLYAIHCESQNCSWWSFVVFESYWLEVLE